MLEIIGECFIKFITLPKLEQFSILNYFMQNQTIALIDDDRNILTSLSIALEKEGFKVQTYIDGESALIGLTRMPPDLAVIDIKMPNMDGE